MNEKWRVHTATGCSVRNESGEVIFEYPNFFQKFDEERYCHWLDYAEHICELHNKDLETRMNTESSSCKADSHSESCIQ